MTVNELTFHGFRNLQAGCIRPCGGVNIVCGENAQGKTNLLEALWLFTGGRSFRGAKDAELTAFGQDKAALQLRFFAQGREQEAKIAFEAGRRRAVLNEIKLKSATAMVGNFCAVIFSPDHLSLVKDGPEKRRRFLDAAICQAKPAYAVALSRFQRGVNQRNALLKELYDRPGLRETLPVWDEKLARLGSVVLQERRNYFQRLAVTAAEVYNGLCAGRESFEIQYLSSGAEKMKGEGKEGVFEKLFSLFEKNREIDCRAGFTTQGPHRDDFSILISGNAARDYGSQGQQRSAVLALKLGEAALLREAIGERPIVLLDDVMSELDASRQDFILNRIEGWQVFITCCEPSPAVRLMEGKRFLMENGVLREQA